MSTGPTGNGLTAAPTYPTKTHNYSPGDQVASSDLNAIQDGVVLTSDQLFAAFGKVAPSRSSSKNLTDSPSPDVHGGGSIWIEAVTTGVTVVVLDNSIDWRDRHIIVAGVVDLAANLAFPGDPADDTVSYDLNDVAAPGVGIHGYFYSEAGYPGTTTPTADANATVTGLERLRVYVRDDGNLCMKMSPYTSNNGRIVAKIDFSPKQEHY